MVPVITSYSIHYTKLYEHVLLHPRCRLSRRPDRRIRPDLHPADESHRGRADAARELPLHEPRGGQARDPESVIQRGGQLEGDHSATRPRATA